MRLQASEAVHQYFVGRAQALAVFYRRFAYRHMQNGVYYCGAGGLGKTWLLKKIYLEFQDDPTRIVPGIIDFFDTRNHSIRGLQATIKERLQAPAAFESYDELTEALDSLRGQAGAMHASVVANLEARANRQFIQCCQEAIRDREIILLFDTFERVQQRYVGQWLTKEFLPQVKDAVVAVAGRPIPGRAGPTSAPMPDSFITYYLGGLEPEEVSDYVGRRPLSLSPKEVQSIGDHTGGAPLMIDLILTLPASFRANFMAELARLPAGALVQEIPALQRGLVRQFAEPPNPENRVIWVMSYFKRRFDVRMLRYLVENAAAWFRSADYERIYRALRNSIYVKEYPEQESHLLHDEVQRMVADFVLREDSALWHDMEPFLRRLIIEDYYTAAIGRADADLARQLRSEQLGYVLDAQPATGLEAYLTHRSEVEHTYDYDFEDLLWGEVRDHLDILENQGYQACDSRGRWLQDHSLFAKAEDHYRQMIVWFPKQALDSHQGLGFAQMRQGKLDDAKEVFNASRELVGEKDHATIAMIENNLGQQAQLSGRWDDALVHYAHSFRAASLAGDRAGLVSVYLNRGYLYSLQGWYSKGQHQCAQAISQLADLPKTPDNIQSEIYAWMNLGTAQRHAGNHELAEAHYTTSLNLARQNHNREAECHALQHLGINAYLRGRRLRRDLLSQSLPSQMQTKLLAQGPEMLAVSGEYQFQAWQRLTGALEIARVADWRGALADGLNRLAKVYREIDRIDKLLTSRMPDLQPPALLQELWNAANEWRIPFEVGYRHDLLTAGRFETLGWFQRAIRLFDLSALMADETNDYHRALDSLTELSRSFIEIKMLDEVEIVLRRIERLKAYDYQEALFAAMNEISRGDLDFRRGLFDSALDKYAEAYEEVARQSGYATYLLIDRLRDLEWRLRELSPATALEWCDTLESRWLVSGVAHYRPDMLDSLERVRIEALAQLKEGR